MYAVGIVGASGRIGLCILKEMQNCSWAKLSCGICRTSALFNTSIKQHFNLNHICDEALFQGSLEQLLLSDIIIDFSLPPATEKLADQCLNKQYKGAMVIGTTGLSKSLQGKIQVLAKHAKVALLSNTSIGIAVMRNALKNALKILDNAEVEIVETHHSGKQDSPSGTSVSLGKTVAEARNVNFDEVAKFGRHGTVQRGENEIGFAVVRGGEAFGEHAVQLYYGSEMLEIKHTAYNRNCFAKNALLIAKKLVSQPEPCFFNDHNIDKLLYK